MRLYRRAQIFLILTILVVTFLVGITSVLIDVQRANYVNPAADNSEVLYAWNNAISSTQQILKIEISQQSKVASADVGPTDVTSNIQTPINDLVNYLNERGLTAIIIIRSANFLISGFNTQSELIQIDASFNFTIMSGSTSIIQTVHMIVQYHAIVTASTLTIFNKINNETTYLPGCTITGGTVIDLNNGSYQHSLVSGTSLQIITPSNVTLEVTV